MPLGGYRNYYMHVHGLQRWRTLIMADRGCMAVQVEIRKRGLGLLRPRPNVGPVCDDSAAQGGVCANAALYKWTFTLFLLIWLCDYIVANRKPLEPAAGVSCPLRTYTAAKSHSSMLTGRPVSSTSCFNQRSVTRSTRCRHSRIVWRSTSLMQKTTRAYCVVILVGIHSYYLRNDLFQALVYYFFQWSRR